MLSNLVKNGETISALLVLKYNGFELKYNQSPDTPPPPGGVWVKLSKDVDDVHHRYAWITLLV